MNTREKFSAGLICLGAILAFLPLSGSRSFVVTPRKLLAESVGSRSYFSVDQIARFIVAEDSTVQIIDLRSPEEFRAFNIPGSRNIPYKEFLKNDPAGFLNNGTIRNIFYSNGDFEANYALVLAKGLNFNNVYVMKGGLNEWFNTVMNSSFAGEKISARENSIFENRTRARKLFTAINSLPDSLKIKFIDARHTAVKKLDGGCE